MRAIDADALLTWFNEYYDDAEVTVGFVDRIIKNAPTIDDDGMTVERLKAEAAALGYTIVKKKELQMKPELIFISEKDGMVTISKEDIESLVDKAYRAGQADATNPWMVYPTWDTNPIPVTRTDITCDGNWAQGTPTGGVKLD